MEAFPFCWAYQVEWKSSLFVEHPTCQSDGECCCLYLKLQEAVKLKPSFADAYLNQGNVYKVSLSVVIENPARERRDNFGLGGKLDLILSWLTRLWECLKMPLCVINVHCRHGLTMLWLMVRYSSYVSILSNPGFLLSLYLGILSFFNKDSEFLPQK